MADTTGKGYSDSGIIEAGAILERLRKIPPQHASRDTVSEYERTLALLAQVVGSPIWFEALAGLGSHLLESPHGDRAANVESAERAYRAMLDLLSPVDATGRWESAISGLANSLVLHPAATIARFDEASALYDQLIARLRVRGDATSLAMTLGNCARLHASVPASDTEAHLSRAIQLQQEAVQLLGGGEGPEAAILRGRARHNLAACYLRRNAGIRSQNVDRAIRELVAALKDRPAELDPIGRVRTLRALALAYPEWSGADSLVQAQTLAAAASDEADRIERGDTRAASRALGWAHFERQKSALDENLAKLYELPPDRRLKWIYSLIQNHQEALGVIPQDTMPVRWAEWVGGLARLLGRLPSLGVWDYVPATNAYFEQAVEALGPREQPRLRRSVLQRWGEFCHEIADFEGSLRAFGEAVVMDNSLLDAITDPEARWIELEQSGSNALFAAYAAAQVARPYEAARLAEARRTRDLADLLDAAHVLTSASRTQSAAIRAAAAEVRRLDDALRDAERRDPEGQMAAFRARLADWIGINPSILQARRTDAAADAPNPVAIEHERLCSELAAARRSLRSLVRPNAPSAVQGFRMVGPEKIASLARATKRALVYLMATVHGGMAVAVFPDGGCESLPLEHLTSDVSRELLYGSGGVPGFVKVATTGKTEGLRASLARIQATLGPTLMEPLRAWLGARGVTRAGLVPLGTLGLLPLHAAGRDDEWTFSYVPSARALAVAVDRLNREAGPGMLIVANPTCTDKPPLPFAIAEARAIAGLRDTNAARVLVRGDATLERVREAGIDAGCVHFACHGRFRPSEPLASHLQLAGHDQLTLADIFSGDMDLTAARLVVLTACESGLVEFRRASDEMLGFPSAMMLAGAPAVVGTMWRVDDAAAALFAVRLCEFLFVHHEEPAEAVSHARAWLREARADELERRVSAMRLALGPDDDEADAALSELWRDLAFGDPARKPYACPEKWAAFMLTGV